MTMTEHFIADRALALMGDAKIYPATAPTILRWLALAKRWAYAHGSSELLAKILGAEYAVAKLRDYAHVPA